MLKRKRISVICVDLETIQAQAAQAQVTRMRVTITCGTMTFTVIALSATDGHLIKRITLVSKNANNAGEIPPKRIRIHRTRFIE